MSTYVYSTILTILCSIHIQCFNINTVIEEFSPDRITEVKQKSLDCELGDLLFITIPGWRDKGGKYFLFKPNGDQIKLNFGLPKVKSSQYNTTNEVTKEKSELEVNRLNATENVESLIDDFIVQGNYWNGTKFIIGPLSEFDHGNWVLSQFYMDNGQLVDEYQVIAINISENIPSEPRNVTLMESDTFKLSFVHPIQNLETCELIAPSTSHDRYYELDSEMKTFCGYKVPNVTKEDCGTWKIVAVGIIVYVTEVILDVVKTDLT